MARARIRPASTPLVGALAARPRLLMALGAGLATFAALAFDPRLAWATRAILAWDLACIVYLVAIVRLMRGAGPARIRDNAANQDQGQWVILGLAMIAAAASIVAVGLELSLARNLDGLERVARIGLAFATVALSWAFVQFVFALHYAHEFYGPSALGQSPEGRGLRFPGDEPPDYWDFVHFSVVIGAACQTADIAFTSKALRRTGTVHGALSFVYNTGVLALTVNLLAGLLGRQAG